MGTIFIFNKMFFLSRQVISNAGGLFRNGNSALAMRRMMLSTSSSNFGRRYQKSHEWAVEEGNGVFKVGLSAWAAESIGDVVFVELPEVGEQREKGEAAAVVESVKSVNDAYSPLTGEIVETNENVVEDPGLINNSPLEDGWLFKIEASNAEEFNELLSEEDYDNLPK